MDVLQKGISKETWQLKVTCPHCSAKLGISYKDLDFLIKRNFLNTPKLYFKTNCCECGGGIRLSKDDVPISIQKAIYNKMNIWERVITFGF